MSKHTQGPWSAEFSAGGPYINGADLLIAVAHPADPDDQDDYYPGPQTEANARLIAAAPDLLAELQNIANADPRKWDEETRDQFQQWAQNRARAVIQKATGEQP